MSTFTIQGMRPQYDRLVIRPMLPATARGLHIPEAYRKNAPYFIARVEAVGQGRVTETGAFVALTVKVGDTVLVEKKAGFPLPIEGDPDLLMISEMHVLAVVDLVEEPRILVVA